MSMNFGEWLKERRQRAGFSQEELAGRARCSKMYVSRLENGASSAASGVPHLPRLDMVERLAAALRAPVNEARAAAGYATVTGDTPQAQRAMALFEALPEDIQYMTIDMLVLLAEKFAPHSEAFRANSPFPAEKKPQRKTTGLATNRRAAKRR